MLVLILLVIKDTFSIFFFFEKQFIIMKEVDRMSKIQVMDEVLANKIAAGEVVEKTMNVVKELVENSIDAGSSEITVKLIDSGVKEVEVSDNGVGMDEERLNEETVPDCDRRDSAVV